MKDAKLAELDALSRELALLVSAARFDTLLARLGEALRCEWGTFWKVNAEEHVLEPVATWSDANVQAFALEQDTKSRRLSLREGNAGHVWRSKRALWTVDLVRDMCLPRSLEATSAGLGGGIWFALKTEQAVYGVIELLGRKLEPASPDFIRHIEAVGEELGALMERASA